MEVKLKKKLHKVFNSERELKRKFGKPNAKKIKLRLSQLEASDNLNDMSLFSGARCHPLKDKYAGKFAVDLEQPFRLIFEPDHDPMPVREDGSLNIERVTKVLITEVKDYH